SAGTPFITSALANGGGTYPLIFVSIFHSGGALSSDGTPQFSTGTSGTWSTGFLTTTGGSKVIFGFGDWDSNNTSDAVGGGSGYTLLDSGNAWSQRMQFKIATDNTGSPYGASFLDISGSRAYMTSIMVLSEAATATPSVV